MGRRKVCQQRAAAVHAHNGHLTTENQNSFLLFAVKFVKLIQAQPDKLQHGHFGDQIFPTSSKDGPGTGHPRGSLLTEPYTLHLMIVFLCGRTFL